MKPKSHLRHSLLLSASTSLLAISSASAADGTWNANSAGNWSDTTKWTSGTVADGAGFTATLSNVITTNRIITLDSDRTIGHISAADSTHDYTISGSSTLTLDVASGSPSLTATDLIRTLDIKTKISGNDGYTIKGAGTVFLSAGVNDYSGEIKVESGRLHVNDSDRLGNTANSVVVDSGAQLFFNAGEAVNTAISISGQGWTEPASVDPQLNKLGALRLANGGDYSGMITLTGNSRIGAAASGSGASLIPTFTISGKITGSFGVDFIGTTLANNGIITHTLTNTGNDYTGDTSITNSVYGGTNRTSRTNLRLGASNVIPNGANAGNVVFALHGTNNASTVALDLRGFNETINGITVTPNSVPFTSIITNGSTSGTNASVLTIGDNDTTSAFPGTISDNNATRTLGITKIGTGTLTLSGANTYRGATNVNAGTLVARSASALGSNNVSITEGAALNYFAASDAALNVGGTLTINGGTGTTIGGSVGSTVTSARMNVTGNALVPTANTQVNVYGVRGVNRLAGTNTYMLITGLGGGATQLDDGTYTLGTVFNNTDFTVANITTSTTGLFIDVTQQTALSGDTYYVGGLTGATNIWAASNGSTASNFSTTSGGTSQALVPGSAANVIVDNNSFATSTVLGADMSISGLTISDNTSNFALNADGYSLTLDSGGITKSNTTTRTATIGANLVLGAAQTWSNSDTGNALVVTSIVTGANSLIVDGAGNTSVTGRLAIGTGTLTKQGNGTLTLSGINTYSGFTTVSGGALNIASTGSLARGNALTVTAGGTSDFANAGQILGAVTNENTATNALNFSASTGTITLASLTGSGNTRFGSNGTVTNGISDGTVTSVGALNANISGTATITVGGLLTGTISAGTVGAGSLVSSSVTGGMNNVIGAATITALDGGTTTVGGVASIGTLTSGTVNLNGSTSSITTLNGDTVNLGSSTVLSVSGGTTTGSITGIGGSLNKTGAATLTLSGTNTYTGTTSINAGTLKLGTTGTLANATSVSIAAGATFDLTETTADSTTYIWNTSSLSASGAATAATISGTAGGTIDMGTTPISLTTDATNASLTVTGADLALGGNAFTVVVPGPALTSGVYTLVSADSITGTVNPTASYTGGNGLAGGATGVVSISGNTVILTVTVTSTPYDTWATSKGLTGAPSSSTDPAKDADPDKDGRNNLAEFAFNGDPLSGADNGKVFVLTEDSDFDVETADKELILTVAVRTGTAAFSGTPSPTAIQATDGITYSIEGSLDLSGFLTTVNIVPTPVTTGLPAAGTGYEYRSFSLNDSNGLTGKGFLRAKVTSP